MREGFSRTSWQQLGDKGNNFSSERLWLSELRNALSLLAKKWTTSAKNGQLQLPKKLLQQKRANINMEEHDESQLNSTIGDN